MKDNVIVIAEAGVNHNGDIKQALMLVDAAKKSGADYVKFQTFKTELNISRKAKKAEYQENGDGKTQFDLVKNLEFKEKDFETIIGYCNDVNIGFLSTAFDLSSLEYLLNKRLDYYKIPSGEITNLPLLRRIGKCGERIIISTGMASLSEVEKALNVLYIAGAKRNNIIVLHCNTEYPTPMEDVNLKAMNTIGVELGVKVGYSDHTLGIEVPIAAVALGATVIEKHFTLNRNLPGPDHKASLEPSELKQMVIAIRNIEKAISGDGKKEATLSEQKNKDVARKSIHTTRIIKKGELITEEAIIALRPGDGISPMKWEEVIGKRVNRDYESNEKIEWDSLL
jgi:N-acetylneuraminate synthase